VIFKIVDTCEIFCFFWIGWVVKRLPRQFQLYIQRNKVLGGPISYYYFSRITYFLFSKARRPFRACGEVHPFHNTVDPPLEKILILYVLSSILYEVCARLFVEQRCMNYIFISDLNQSTKEKDTSTYSHIHDYLWLVISLIFIRAAAGTWLLFCMTRTRAQVEKFNPASLVRWRRSPLALIDFYTLYFPRARYIIVCIWPCGWIRGIGK
jgi:hypothetical protein